MSKQLLTGCTANPDVGALKGARNGWDHLQNVRGIGQRIAKRKGVQHRTYLSSGIMGIFDLRNDGDPTSPDKILVITGDGSFNLFDYSEFISTFDYLFATGITYYQQSANLAWWSITINSSGAITVAGVAAPATTLSSDLVIGQDQLLGFADSTGIWRLYVDRTAPTMPALATKRYVTSSSDTTYTSTRAFVSGVGIVITDNIEPQRWRISVSNLGAITITSI